MPDYFLIALNKDTNEPTIIPLKEKWYLGKNGGNNFEKKVSLEAIDLTTTRFESLNEMIDQMYTNKYISTKNIDLFIAKKIKRNNKEYIKTHELIFNPENKERIFDLRRIAFSFLNGTKNNEKALIDKVFNKLISKANSVENFRNMLTCEMTNIPKRITDAFWKGHQSYNLKYQNLSSLENYTVIRSIVEALNRYDFLSLIPGDTFVNNIDYLNSFTANRKKIEPTLLTILDKNYFPGQYSFLDENYAYKEEPPTTSNYFEKIKQLDSESKKQQIINTFLQLPFGFLSIKNNIPAINETFFSSDYPISTLEKEQLQTLLPNYLFINLEVYTAHKNQLQKIQSYCGNTTLLEQEIRYDKEKILKALNTKNLNKIFLWTLIYEDYQEKLHKRKNNSEKKV